MLAGGIYERTSGAAGQPLQGGYRRRAPEQTVLHELVSRHAQTLLAELRDTDGRGLPRYVDRELAEYLRCGILAHGFARVRCQACDDELLVAFSCKRRGICPSCTARRMADTAAHLVDRVLPSAPYRRISYQLKRPWPDGRTHLVLEPVAFLRRLVGIIPPPRRHLVRYSGVFGPASQRRAQLRALVPAPAGEPPPGAATPSGSPRAGRVPWAELLRRVFATDVLACPCGGRRRVVAVVVDAAMARAVLAVLGLPCPPATFAPARDPPQAELWFDDAS